MEEEFVAEELEGLTESELAQRAVMIREKVRIRRACTSRKQPTQPEPARRDRWVNWDAVYTPGNPDEWDLIERLIAGFECDAASERQDQELSRQSWERLQERVVHTDTPLENPCAHLQKKPLNPKPQNGSMPVTRNHESTQLVYARMDEIVRQMESGVRSGQISQRWGIARETLYRLLRRYGREDLIGKRGGQKKQSPQQPGVH